jgi:hypothetical protein
MTDKKEIRSTEEKLFWSYFMNDKGELEYYKLCEQCKNDCKKSFRISGNRCPKFSVE